MIRYTENLIPKMTSNTSPSGEVFASSTYTGYSAHNAFDRVDNDYGWFASVGVQFLGYRFEKPLIINKYTIKARNYTGTVASGGIFQAPKNWTFEGSNNGIDWVVLDTRLNISQWQIGVAKEFEFTNSTPYLNYRIRVTANNGSSTFICIGEMEMMGRIDYKILINNQEEYYYHDLVSWKSLGTNPTSSQIETFGMDTVSASQIKEFDDLYGMNWHVYCWSKSDFISSSELMASPKPQILTAKSSIQLTGVESATFNWLATGDSRVALSVDDGVTYHAFKNGIWVEVTNDMSNAMTASEYSAMTWEQYKVLAQDSNFLKHQYYIPDNSAVDDILITVELMGINQIANSSSYELSYDQSAKTIRYSIKSDGTYFANYVDTSTL